MIIHIHPQLSENWGKKNATSRQRKKLLPFIEVVCDKLYSLWQLQTLMVVCHLAVSGTTTPRPDFFQQVQTTLLHHKLQEKKDLAVNPPRYQKLVFQEVFLSSQVNANERARIKICMQKIYTKTKESLQQ